MRVSRLYDLFPQHCIMPTFTRKEHVTTVNDKPKEAILSLNKKAKKHLLKAMATSMVIMTVTDNAPSQRMDKAPTSEGVPHG